MSEPESVRIWKCQNLKVSEPDSVRMFWNQKVSEFQGMKIFQNWKVSELPEAVIIYWNWIVKNPKDFNQLNVAVSRILLIQA